MPQTMRAGRRPVLLAAVLLGMAFFAGLSFMVPQQRVASSARATDRSLFVSGGKCDTAPAEPATQRRVIY